jgi:hypothetical protein
MSRWKQQHTVTKLPHKATHVIKHSFKMKRNFWLINACKHSCAGNVGRKGNLPATNFVDVKLWSDVEHVIANRYQENLSLDGWSSSVIVRAL